MECNGNLAFFQVTVTQSSQDSGHPVAVAHTVRTNTDTMRTKDMANPIKMSQTKVRKIPKRM